MSLLLRRRSGQHLENLSDESLVSHKSQIVPAMTLPDDYDPRIRGKGVHDFSAPRPHRGFSYHNESQSSTDSTSKEKLRQESRADGVLNPDRNSADSSPSKVDRAHTPVFREHFDDDLQPQESESAIRAEALANHDFLKRASLQASDKSSKSIPPFARHSPLSSPLKSISPPLDPAEQRTESPPLATVPESPLTGTFEGRAFQRTPPKARSRALSGGDTAWQPAGLPAHMNSRSSRFSFQMSGGDSSTEERLLEERHKAKAAAKAEAATSTTPSQRHEPDPYEEEEDDAYDYDGLDDGGYEEEINMIGADADDEDGFGASPLNAQPTLSMGDVGFQNAWKISSNPMNEFSLPELATLLSQNTTGHAIEPMDEAEDDLAAHTSEHETYFATSSHPIQDIHGLGLMDLNADAVAGAQRIHETPDAPPSHAVSGRQDSGKAIHAKELSDDLYFDDGLIEVRDDVDGDDFDESTFDDPSGPLYARPPPKPRPDAAALDVGDAFPSSGPVNGGAETSNTDIIDDNDALHQRPRNTSSALPLHQSHKLSGGPSAGFNNLMAYHSALADAASKAAANGRFTRKDSTSNNSAPFTLSTEESESNVAALDDSRSSLMPSDGCSSHESATTSTGLGMTGPADEGYGITRFQDDYDYSDFDDNAEDDPMIAAANAEALAYDSDGFYGQEFGFYAAPIQSLEDAEALGAFGGFFGPKGFVEIGRRNTLREPNLTPITERSEFSTRNSFISLKQFNSSSLTGALPSPGLAQLARMSPYGFPNGYATDEDTSDMEMSLLQLQKLKKSAFGGSQVSLGSTASSPRNSSPTVQLGHFKDRGQNHMVPVQQAIESDKGYSSTPDSGSVAAKAVTDGDLENETQDMDDYEAELDGAEFNYNRDSFISDDEDDEDYPGRSTSPTITAANQLEPAHAGSERQERTAYPHLSLNTNQPSAYSLPTISPTSPFLGFPTSTTSTFFPSAPSSTTSSPANLKPAQLPPFTFPANTTAYTPLLHSPTLVSPPQPPPPLTSTTLDRSRAATTKGHSRQGSAADSVAYVREDDEKGGKRWVLERRRTAETGELELIGRTVVLGGRI
ncbi:hypothetical protein W97_08380 [Coniosporium apollinis CBS 100218]|uniref:AGC-kinase C-terminal domain-containing protein n=1 Tax=Coniosporium apollinis (strain CBS 100218) TaxID=1168221 RepID=R7Z4H7_CONA1|nr:uncharacterized protein W97_08380 [Coniosporium apollinis CBS 100218]EON69067.1 hypothetical protein W97_08380 [Coniosporium apollinis CBS 100218]